MRDDDIEIAVSADAEDIPEYKNITAKKDWQVSRKFVEPRRLL